MFCLLLAFSFRQTRSRDSKAPTHQTQHRAHSGALNLQLVVFENLSATHPNLTPVNYASTPTHPSRKMLYPLSRTLVRLN